jgi:anti-sigma factor RsiW
MDPDPHALTGAFAAGALADAERVAFEDHLVGCRTCRDEVAALQDAAVLLAVPFEVPPPPGMKAAVLAEIARTPQQPPPALR